MDHPHVHKNHYCQENHIRDIDHRKHFHVQYPSDILPCQPQHPQDTEIADARAQNETNNEISNEEQCNNDKDSNRHLDDRNYIIHIINHGVFQ